MAEDTHPTIQSTNQSGGVECASCKQCTMMTIVLKFRQAAYVFFWDKSCKHNQGRDFTYTYAAYPSRRRGVLTAENAENAQRNVKMNLALFV